MVQPRPSDPFTPIRGPIRGALAGLAMKRSKGSRASPAELLSGAQQEEIDQDDLLALDVGRGTQLPIDYRALFESAPFPCVVTDTRAVIHQANQAATVLFGSQPPSLVGTLLSAWILPDDQEAFDQWLTHVRAYPSPGTLTVRMRSLQDEPFIVELSVSSVRDEHARPVLLSWAIRRAPRRCEAQLLEDERLFMGLVESVPVGIIQTDTERRCLYANVGWQVLTGLGLRESVGYGWSRALHPDDRDRFLREWSQAAREGRDFATEHRIVGLGGEVLWVLTRVSPQWSDDGKLTGYVSTVGDVTERNREIEGLHASERRFRVLTERSWDAVSLVSAQGVILYDTPAASTRILGYATGELVGRSAFEQIHPDDVQRIGRLFAELVDQPGATVTAEFRHRHKDGSWRWIECAGTNLLAEPSVQAVVCNYHDITQRRLAEEEIKQRNRELAALNTVTAAVSNTLELPEVLDTFQRLVTEELSIPAGMIYLRDPDEGGLSLQDSWGLPISMPEALAGFPLTGSDYDRVIHQKKAVLVPDFREIGRFRALSLDVAHPEWESYLCVPLLANDCIQGAIGLFCRSGVLFAEDQVAVFEALGREVGVAIQNARLFEQVRHGQEQLEVLSRRLVELQEMERRHIARELHDEVGQLLTGLKLSLEVAIRQPRMADHQPLTEVLAQVTELIARVRNLSLDLRPAMLDDLGLLPTLLWHFDRYTAQTNIQVVFEQTGLERRFAPAIETAAYRIVQEALTNVARHGRVRDVTVTLWAQGEHLCVEVYDQGSGFDLRRSRRDGSSSGLAGMRERAVLLGGKLSLCSVEGRGTQLLALLPIKQSEGDGD